MFSPERHRLLIVMLRRWLIGIVGIILFSGCSMPLNNPSDLSSAELNQPNKTGEVELGEYGFAPELTQSNWLNTDHPIRLADLKGKVVLLEFWTFG